MRTQSEIEDRIRLLLCDELTRRVREAETRLPAMCVHNHRQPLDTRKTVEDMPNDTFNRMSDHRGLPVVQTIGLCMLGSENIEEWPGNICEDPIDAARCPYFKGSSSKADVFRRLKSDLDNPDWVRDSIPELYGLLWALDSSPPALPWWKRLWFKLLRIHVQPVLDPEAAAALLPAMPED